MVTVATPASHSSQVLVDTNVDTLALADTAPSSLATDVRGYLVSGGKDAVIRCHDVATGEIVWEYAGHGDYINAALLHSTCHAGWHSL